MASKFPPVNHPDGYTEEYLRDQFIHRGIDFDDFMASQSGKQVQVDGGNIIHYAADVKRYIRVQSQEPLRY